MPASQHRFLRLSRSFGWLLQSGFVQRQLASRVRAGRAGPSESARTRGGSFFWGEARNAAGAVVTSRLQGPEGYTLTADTAVRCVQRVVAGTAPIGFQTPSRAFGADFVLEADGVTRTDLELG